MRRFLKTLLVSAILFAATHVHAARNCSRSSEDFIAVSLPDYSSKFTFGAWLKAATTPGSTDVFTVISKGKSGSVNTDINFQIDYRGSGASQSVSAYWTNPTTINQWNADCGLCYGSGAFNLLVVTVDWTTNPDTVQFYHNSTALNPTLASGSNNVTPTNGATQVSNICHYNDLAVVGNLAWDGPIAEAFILADTLTQSQVTRLSKGYSPLFLGKRLDAYWPLRGRQSPEPDIFNKLNGTLTGTSFATHPSVYYPRGMK